MSSRERKETAVNQKPMAELIFSTNREASLARPGDQVATILVPLDGSLHALAALPVARVLAELAQGVIHLAHVAEAILPAQEVLHKLGLSARDARDAVVHQAAGDPAEGNRAPGQGTTECLERDGHVYGAKRAQRLGSGSVGPAGIAHRAPAPGWFVAPRAVATHPLPIGTNPFLPL